MPILNLAVLGRRFRAAVLTGLSLAILPMAHASSVTLTAEPGVVVAGASQFTFDELNGSVYERTDLTGDSFTTNGYEQITSAELNNVTFDPSGNGSTYSLYLAFNETGVQSASNFNDSSTGTVDTLSYTLYEVAGASTFGINGSNDPFVTNSGTPVAVATGTLEEGTTSFSAAPLGSGSTVDVTFDQLLPGFLVSPPASLSLDLTQDVDSDLINVLNGGTTFTINGGSVSLTADTPSIAPTPEPSSLILLGTGLVTAAAAFRRRLARI